MPLDDLESGEGSTGFANAELDALAAELDELAESANDPWDLLQRLTTAHTKPGLQVERTPGLVMAERALSYDFEAHPSKYGAVTLGLRFSSAAGDWPPALDIVDDGEKTFWADLADRLTHPLPRAQFSDLALTTGKRTGLAFATSLAEAYLALGGDSDLDPYFRASCLRRAWSLARQFSLPSESNARRMLFELAQRFVVTSGVPAGVLFRPVEPLAVPPRTGDFADPGRNDVVELVDAIEDAHGSSPTVLEAVFEVREQLAITPEDRDSARRSLVNGYLGLAESSDGLLRMSWLREAAVAAQKYGLTDLREAAVTLLQTISVDDLGLNSITTDLLLPRHAFDGRLSRFRWSRDALSALEIWLAGPPLTGSYHANLAKARELSSGGAVQLVSRIEISPEGLPIRSSAGPESAANEMLERLELMAAKTYSIMVANELESIRTEYGKTTVEALAKHLATRFGSDFELATAFGEAVGSFWDGRYADAGRAAFPLVEAGARGVLLAIGEPLFRIGTGEAEGHFPSLEIYAERLEANGFDQDWLRTLRNPVATLRNAIAHGHKLTLEREEAALLLRVAALLVTLSSPRATAVSRSEVLPRLRDPVGYVAQQGTLVRRWSLVWVQQPGEMFRTPRRVLARLSRMLPNFRARRDLGD